MAPSRTPRPRKPRRKIARLNLGLGDFEWPGASLNSEGWARDSFFEAIKFTKPEVLGDLQSRALAAARAFASERVRLSGSVDQLHWEDAQSGS